MKNFIKPLVVPFVFIFFTACESHKLITKDPATISTGSESQETMKEFISGVVNGIQQGKDGYTAKIITASNYIYYVTISPSNLKDPAQYRSVKEGDTMTVKGDQWKKGDENHITVRESK
ncbi:MAG: hypothetical protein ABI091_29445 [Ferruginibacter sp.]